MDSSSVVSTCPKSFASDIQVVEFEQQLSLLSVLGEPLRHSDTRRNVQFTAGDGSEMRVNLEVIDLRRRADTGGVDNFSSFEARDDEASQSSSEHYVQPVISSNRLERASSQAAKERERMRILQPKAHEKDLDLPNKNAAKQPATLHEPTQHLASLFMVFRLSDVAFLVFCPLVWICLVHPAAGVGCASFPTHIQGRLNNLTSSSFLSVLTTSVAGCVRDKMPLLSSPVARNSLMLSRPATR